MGNFSNNGNFLKKGEKGLEKGKKTIKPKQEGGLTLLFSFIWCKKNFGIFYKLKKMV